MARKRSETVEGEEKSGGDSKRKADLLKRAKDRYKVIEDYWADNRKRALDDIKFRAGDQWPEAIKKIRDDDNRPSLVLDKINQYVRQVVNDGRQNRPAIKFRPKGDGDEDVADAFQGLTRSILMASNADQAFDTALDHSAGHGFGYFRILTEYVSQKSFDQEIRVERVRNSLAVLLAPHQAADGSDAEDGFVVDTMPKSVFKSKWPKAEKADWKSCGSEFGEGWLTDDDVRVVEYWYKEPATETIYQLADGVTVTKDEYEKAIAEGVQDMMPVKETREAKVDKVKWCRMTGAEILEEREWAGSYIPIIPVYGTETDVNGKVEYSGLVRLGRDGQMLYNFARTAFAERVALTPKAPWVAAAGQTEDDPNWDTAHTKNHPVLTYNPVEINGSALPPPRREAAADIPSGFAAEMQHAEHDIQSALGMYNATLGAPSNEKSGRAIMARQREGDVATFHYHDNLNRAIRFLGRQLLDLIPKIYDSRRVVRLVSEDGEAKEAYVQAQPLPSGAPKADMDGLKIFNLGAGEYDVEVDTGPSYTTKRMEALDAQLEIARGNPQVMMTHGDLIAWNMDWPGAEEWAERTKALMPPEMKAAIEKAEQAEEGEEDPKIRAVVEAAQVEIDKREQALQQAQQIVAEAQEALKAAEAEADEARRMAEVKEFEAETKRYEAETKRLELTSVAMSPDQVMAIVQQTVMQALTPEDIAGAPVDPVRALAEQVQGMSQAMLQAMAVNAQQSEKLVRAVLAPKRRIPNRDPGTGLVLDVTEVPVLNETGGEDAEGNGFPA